MNDNLRFGAFLREVRIRKGYSIRELAKISNVSPYYLSYIESGVKSNPSLDVMGRIIKSLSMSKTEIEMFLDLHAKANGCVSYDLVDFIMGNDEIRETIRNERDKPGSSPTWNDFIKKMNNG